MCIRDRSHVVTICPMELLRDFLHRWVWESREQAGSAIDLSIAGQHWDRVHCARWLLGCRRRIAAAMDIWISCQHWQYQHTARALVAWKVFQVDDRRASLRAEQHTLVWDAHMLQGGCLLYTSPSPRDS
eukprot:TRINITY_DN44954_c0_g1_i1.p2 TRINITY_DN44954_c0_g1~~TRINITY_DN44954_c0_g1_i1.p2  ORF type:complete len:129 (-),score=24.05 TRINITY_DN44954_c0_g1_i1:145-531(-)